MVWTMRQTFTAAGPWLLLLLLLLLGLLLRLLLRLLLLLTQPRVVQTHPDARLSRCGRAEAGLSHIPHSSSQEGKHFADLI